MFLTKNIQACIKTLCILIPTIFIYFCILKINYLTLLFLISLYSIFILYFIFYIYKQKNKNNNKNIYYNSIFKDKEYLLFKENLFKFYYSTLIILFYFLFKKNCFFLLLELNYLFILLLLIIIIVYSLLFSNAFNTKIFYIYKEIKNCIHYLNEINKDYKFRFKNKNLDLRTNNVGLYYPRIFSRNFSTFTNFENKDDVNTEDDLEKNLSDVDYTINNYSDLSYEKAKELKDFHSKYDVYNGFYGYSHVCHLGTYSELDNLDFNSFLINKKLRSLLEAIPEDTVFTILPVIRFEVPDVEFSSITLTEAIKVTRYTPANLLGRRILQLIKNKFTFYNIDPQAVDTFIMGRP